MSAPFPLAPAVVSPPVTQTPPLSQEREAAGGRDVDGSSSGSLVADARADQTPAERTLSALAERLRQSGDDAALLVASVSFALDDIALPGFDGLAQDGLFGAIDNSAWRLALTSLRGASVDAEEALSSAASPRDAAQAVQAALQDPVRVASATLTAGFVWWLTRSGGLLTSILMGIPAWRHVDLLPVLAPRPDDEDEDEDADLPDHRSAEETAQDSVVDGLFSNTSRLFGESRYMP